MSRYFSHLNAARTILDLYRGTEPFALFLKKYFAGHKKFGSSDRKNISQLCYCYFRTGHAFERKAIEEKIIYSLFLCAEQPDPQLAFHQPDLNEKTGLALDEKIGLVNEPGIMEKIFPWENRLSPSIQKKEFIKSHLIQPLFFLRARPGKVKTVSDILSQNDIPFEKRDDDCFALHNASKVEPIIKLNREAVVQDYSSQRVGELMELIKPNDPGGLTRVWDCCAASGGKSILAADKFGNIELTVSDIRKSVLVNLDKRMAEAGISPSRSFVADLTRPVLPVTKSYFDLVIADVPCTGSGTWSRNPEQLYFFKEEAIERFSVLQRQIAGNIIRHIKKNGYLLYITCSVFSKENEEQGEWLVSNFPLKLIQQKYFMGYNERADTLFGSLFRLE